MQAMSVFQDSVLNFVSYMNTPVLIDCLVFNVKRAVYQLYSLRVPDCSMNIFKFLFSTNAHPFNHCIFINILYYSYSPFKHFFFLSNLHYFYFPSFFQILV